MVRLNQRSYAMPSPVPSARRANGRVPKRDPKATIMIKPAASMAWAPRIETSPLGMASTACRRRRTEGLPAHWLRRSPAARRAWPGATDQEDGPVADHPGDDRERRRRQLDDEHRRQMRQQEVASRRPSPAAHAALVERRAWTLRGPVGGVRQRSQPAMRRLWRLAWPESCRGPRFADRMWGRIRIRVQHLVVPNRGRPLRQRSATP